MKIEIRYRWRVRSPDDRWFNTRYAASEESIRKQHPDAVPVGGTREERIILDQPAELIAASLHSPRTSPSVLIWPCTIPGRDGLIPLTAPLSHYTVTQEGEEWVVMLNEEVLMYRGPGPVRIEAMS
jgi:hypothetical protein